MSEKRSQLKISSNEITASRPTKCNLIYIKLFKMTINILLIKETKPVVVCYQNQPRILGP